MIEKILLQFGFYRKRVAIMDAYALRLSEAQDAYVALVGTYKEEAKRHLIAQKRIKDLGSIILEYERYATPYARAEGEKAGECHIEAFHGIPYLPILLDEVVPQIPELRIAWAKGFRSKFKGEVAE